MIKKVVFSVAIGATAGILVQYAAWAIIGYHLALPIGGIVAGVVTFSTAKMMIGWKV